MELVSSLLKILGSIVLIFLVFVLIFSSGYFLGLKESSTQTKLVQESPSPSPVASLQKPSPQPTSRAQTTNLSKTTLKASYSGPELWEAVNKARTEHGVSQLSQRDILCTVAAIRLSELRQLGKLDGHEGFRPTYEKYKDDSDMPSNISEFLISGYPTADQAVAGWLDTLGHKKLITGGEYVWGCIYAVDGFGVAIAGY